MVSHRHPENTAAAEKEQVTPVYVSDVSFPHHNTTETIFTSSMYCSCLWQWHKQHHRNHWKIQWKEKGDKSCLTHTSSQRGGYGPSGIKLLVTIATISSSDCSWPHQQDPAQPFYFFKCIVHIFFNHIFHNSTKKLMTFIVMHQNTHRNSPKFHYNHKYKHLQWRTVIKQALASSILRDLAGDGHNRLGLCSLLGTWWNTHHKPLAGLRDESVTALMDQQFAVDTLVALPAQPPYPFTTVATVGFL